jgi:polyphosphate kinase 2 (PPK2 family)
VADDQNQKPELPFTSRRMNVLWDTYRLRDMDPPERGYWDEYTDVMKDSYGIGLRVHGYV